MHSKTYNIQVDIPVESCIKCGRRPVVEQTSREWIILCPNPLCDNAVKGKFLNFNEWNRINKK
jgi:hypothetical protein